MYKRQGYDTTNYLKARDFDSGSSNHILTNSTIELNFLVPAQVGYGNVFADKTSAVDDAIFRLNQTVLGYVESGEIESQTMDIVDVPSLWDLTSFEVIVW